MPKTLQLFVLLITSLIGPLAALLITWFPVTSIIDVVATEQVSAAALEELRHSPKDEVLRELHQIGVSVPKFGAWERDQILSAADELFMGRYTLGGKSIAVTLPFDGTKEVFDVPGWDLDLCSFIVPALLAHAFEISQDTRYVKAAVD
jgi:hypothetical protein